MFHVNLRVPVASLPLEHGASFALSERPSHHQSADAARRTARCPPSPNISRCPSRVIHRMENLKLSELKAKSPAELLAFAEEHEVENASTMRKQELMFAILKELAAQRSRDHRRRRGRGAARRLRLPALARRQLPARARTTSTSRPARSAASRCAPATPSRARSALPRKASAISRCSRSRPSISRTPRRSATRSISTT